jgi:hypothetical protein
MTRTSWVELCVSDFAQSIAWFENVLLVENVEAYRQAQQALAEIVRPIADYP